MLAEAITAAHPTKTDVLAALRQASVATGSDFNYLLGTAMRESSLKPHAKSNSSSAAGLFQFVSQTWFGMIKEYGAKYGLGSYADAIHKSADGRYHADNRADRQAILALRNDPRVSALMAGEYANQTKVELETRLGRNVCGGELYAAHFLGPGAACRLIELSDRHPAAKAAAYFPAAANANRTVFYHRNGTPKSVREVYQWALNQPKVPAQDLAAPMAAPALALQVPAAMPPSAASSLGMFPAPPKGDAWPSLSLASGGNETSAAALFGSALPQASFVLTPGVVGILASLGPDNRRDSEAKGIV